MKSITHGEMWALRCRGEVTTEMSSQVGCSMVSTKFRRGRSSHKNRIHTLIGRSVLLQLLIVSINSSRVYALCISIQFSYMRFTDDYWARVVSHNCYCYIAPRLCPFLDVSVGQSWRDLCKLDVWVHLTVQSCVTKYWDSFIAWRKRQELLKAMFEQGQTTCEDTSIFVYRIWGGILSIGL